MAAKRMRQDGDGEIGQDGSVSKRVRLTASLDEWNDEVAAVRQGLSIIATPTKARRGRPPGSGQKQETPTSRLHTQDGIETKLKTKGRNTFSTPSKFRANEETESPAPIVRNADRSARRKSARKIIDQTLANDANDDDGIGEEDILARKILEADEAESEDQQEEPEEDLSGKSTPANTPSRYKRGQRKISPPPPQNLPPHEQYFWQNRPGKIKISDNTLSSLSLLSHEQYHNQINDYADPHALSYTFLHSLHSRSFPQWHFELSQSFNICLYGYGSKRTLVTDFAEYLHDSSPSPPPKILIVNGYTTTLTLRQMFTTLAPLIYNTTPTNLPKLPTQPHTLLTHLLNHLTTNPPSQPLKIFINSLDAPPLRRSPNPTLLAQLGAHPHIRLLATCDTPNFPLLWDTSLRSQYNFLFHDTTTFLSYAGVETSDVIASVNELLGRSGRNVKGKEGVGFVLRSLPENARNLYRVLVANILAAVDDDDGGDAAGVEYRSLYQKAVEEFICSSEIGFRQLLKEFWDHDMLVSKRDGGRGGEVLGVPFRREEMEAILEELVS